MNRSRLMADVTSCPNCRRPLVVPNPAKCTCGAGLSVGSRERTTPAESAPTEEPGTPLLTIAMQGEQQIVLMEQLMASESRQYFIHSFDGRPMKDSELGLPPGTLGGELATAIGRPPEIFADVPQLVSLLTFNEGTVPTTPAQRVAQIEHLTALARIAAASPATRALVLYGPDRMLTPSEFLARSEARPNHPGAELMVWVAVKNRNGVLSTLGLAALGLPEAWLSLGAKASPEELENGTNVLLTLGMTMMQQHGRVADGFQIGQTWETQFDGEKMCVTSTVEKIPFWKRLFR